MASNDLWGQIQQNNGLGKNQAGLASNKAQADQGYKGYGMTKGQGGYQAPAAPQTAISPPGQPTSKWARLAQVGAQKVQSLLSGIPYAALSAAKAVGRPAKDVVTGKGGKAVHDYAQLTSDVTGGAVNQFDQAAKYVPKAVAREVQNKPVSDVQQQAFKTTNSGKIAKKIVGATAGSAALLVGGGEAAGTKATAETGLKAGVKKTITGATAGATANGSATALSNPNAKARDVLKAAGEGAAIGGGATAGGFLVKNGRMLFNKSPIKTNPDVLKSNQIDELTKTTKINVADQSSGATKGKVSSTLPTAKTNDPIIERPSSKGYSDINFRLQFNKGAKDLVSKTPDKWVYMDEKFNKSKDPITQVVGTLSHTSSKNTIREAVNHLLPEIDSSAQNRLVKDISNAKNHQEVADHLWDAAKIHEIKMNTPGTPMAKKISFEDKSNNNSDHGSDYKMPPLPGHEGYPSGSKISDMGGSRPNPELQTAIEKAHNAGDVATTEKLIGQLPDASTRDAMRSSVGIPTKETKLIVNPKTMKTERVPISEAKVENNSEIASISQDVSRATSGEKVTKEPLANTNKDIKGITAKVQEKLAPKSSGMLNPEIGAARQGNTELAKAGRAISSGHSLASYGARTTADKFEALYKDFTDKGGTKESFIKGVEDGTGTHEAQTFWKQHFQQLGEQLQRSGVLKNGAKDASYVPRVAQFNKKGGSVAGLSKSGGFAKGRALADATDEMGHSTNDLYKTHGDYKSAVESQGGKVLDDPVKLMQQATETRLKAISNAKGLEQLDKTPMRDGRAATITYSQKDGLPPGHRDYNTTLLPGRAVHPEATNMVKAITRTASLSDNALEHVAAKTNSVVKRLVTINGLVHGKNFTLSSIYENGLRGTALAMHDAKLASEDDWNRAIKNGFAPSRSGKSNVFDEALDGKGNLGKATSVLGKLRDRSDKALFEGFGDKLGMSTYMRTEKQLIKQGLNKDEAGKIAADTANRVIFGQRSTETSAMLRETSRLAFFAGKYFQSTLSRGTKAIGLAKDATLSDAAQRAEQRQAAKSVARGFTYLFGAAQAINYATTGHSTFQNKDSKLSPVFYVDKSTGKEYHLTNWYGQIGELFNFANPKTFVNKTSPIVQEGAKVISNSDSFTGQPIYNKEASGLRQSGEILANALSNFATPLGFQVSGLQKTFGSGGAPLAVTATKTLGFGASSVDNSQMGKDILSRYYATLPAGSGQSQNAKLSASEAAARNDMAHGKTDSPNIQAVRGQMSATQFKIFMKTGADSAVQRAFDKLPNEQKMEIINSYSPQQLKEINLDTFAKSVVSSSAKNTISSLQSKGITVDQIKQALTKVGYNDNQLQQLKIQAKKQASAQAKISRKQPKFVNPVL